METSSHNIWISNHFRISVETSYRSGNNTWVSRVRAYRNDTGEFVNKGFNVSGDSLASAEEIAQKRSTQELVPALQAAGTPSDWNSESRKILVRCSSILATVTNFGVFCSTEISDADDDHLFYERYPSFWIKLIELSARLSRDIDSLDDEQRLSLLIVPDEVFVDPSLSWCLEEFDRRHRIYSFFSNPTVAERETHEAQSQRLSARFKDLGW